MSPSAPIPVLVNEGAGRAAAVLRRVEDDPRCRPVTVPAGAIESAVRRAAADGASTVVVAGGDGTLATAAHALAGSGVALGVVPAGTLNHFALEHGIPSDPAEALEVALGGRPQRVDVGTLGERTFLNTSAVGAYVPYVRLRERWQRWIGYYPASAAAALVVFARLGSFTVEVEVGGEVRRFRTPLLFVGVGERTLRPPKLGARRPGGARGLHVLIVRETSRSRLLVMALRTLIRHVRPWAGAAEVVSLQVERCTVMLRRPSRHVALDGEIVRQSGPLRYALRRDALTVRVP